MIDKIIDFFKRNPHIDVVYVGNDKLFYNAGAAASYCDKPYAVTREKALNFESEGNNKTPPENTNISTPGGNTDESTSKGIESTPGGNTDENTTKTDVGSGENVDNTVNEIKNKTKK